MAGQKAVIDENFQKVLAHFAALKQKAEQRRLVNQAVPWFRPPTDNWQGGLVTAQDYVDVHKAFNTDKAEEKLIEAFTAEDPGNTGDGVILPLQIDYMAQAERAYRARALQSFPRMLAHSAARERGHGQPNGLFQGQVLQYLTTLMQQGAS
jgi:hypothetical protein